MNKVITRIAAIVLLISVLALQGCADNKSPMPSIVGRPIPTLPASGTEQYSTVNGKIRTSVYYVSGNNLEKVTSEHIEVGNADPVTALVSYLIATNSDTFEPFRGISCVGAEVSGEFCTLYLTGQLADDIRDWFKIEAAIAATLFDFCNIRNTVILFNGVAVNINGIYTGLVRYKSDMKQALEDYITARYKGADHAEGYVMQENIYLTYYMKDDSTDYLCAKLGEVKLSQDARRGDPCSFAEILIDMVLNASLPMLKPIEVTSPEGVISFQVNDMTPDGTLNIEVRGTNAQWIYDALALSLIGNVPRVNKISVGISETEGADMRYIEVDRNSAKGNMGTFASLYIPVDNQSLLTDEVRPLKQSDAYDPGEVLKLFFDDEIITQTSLPITLMRNYMVKTDAKGNEYVDVYVVGDTAVINFGAGFKNAVLEYYINDPDCEGTVADKERFLVFSLVNSLVELPQIHNVRFIEDGKPMGLLVNINLDTDLLANPGLNDN